MNKTISNRSFSKLTSPVPEPRVNSDVLNLPVTESRVAIPAPSARSSWVAAPRPCRPVEEALGLYRELAEANPAYQPNLAAALNNLGNRCTHDLRRS
jgi:hypothetical protein